MGPNEEFCQRLNSGMQVGELTRMTAVLSGAYHNEQQQKITKSDTHRRWRVQPKIDHNVYY